MKVSYVEGIFECTNPILGKDDDEEEEEEETLTLTLNIPMRKLNKITFNNEVISILRI